MKPLLTGAQAPLLLAFRRLLAADAEFCRLADVSARELPQLIVESAEIDEWTSATFVGRQHRIGVRLVTTTALPPAGYDRIALLADAAVIELARHIVVEVECRDFAATDGPGHGVSFVIAATTLDD